MKITVGLIGLNDVQAKIRSLPAKAKTELDGVVEKRTLLMVNESRERAPKLSGKLANSIDIIPSETRPMTRGYGTNVEYARRQEFEHKTHKGYMRKTIAKHRPLFFEDVRSYLSKW